jgi:hypothetical protein
MVYKVEKEGVSPVIMPAPMLHTLILPSTVIINVDVVVK